MNNQVVIYELPDGKTAVDVTLQDDTLWMSQEEIAALFNQDIATIKHMLSEHTDISHVEGRYDLDVILSVGYRVSTKAGAQFRNWANAILKEYLLKGFSINEKLLKEQQQQLDVLRQTVWFMGSVSDRPDASSDEVSGLMKVLTDYSYALDVLDQYDHQRLTISATHTGQSFIFTYEEAMFAIHGLKDKFGGSSLFGNEKDESFQSSIATIYQSFGGQELYPSIEEKAASLLYFVVKNHSFSDGNKRIAAFLFVWFLERNHLLYRADGAKRIADNALVALTLMIAESKPGEKDIIVQVVVNLINGYN